MAHYRRISAPRALGLLMSCLVATAALACGTLPFASDPAASYTHGSGQPLRIAIVDEAGGDWSPMLVGAVMRFRDAVPMIAFQRDPAGANIVVTVRRYTDAAPPALDGYTFQPGVGGFAAVYDAAGVACNYPPSPLPQNCSGEIARTYIYVNDQMPAGADISERRQRVLLHELGHAMGLTRHSANIGADQLSERYGW